MNVMKILMVLILLKVTFLFYNSNLLDFGTCHIDKNFRQNFRISLLIFAIVAIFISSVASFFLISERDSWFRSCFKKSKNEENEEKRFSDEDSQLTGMHLGEESEEEVEGTGEKEKEFSKKKTTLKQKKEKKESLKVKILNNLSKTNLQQRKNRQSNLRLTLFSLGTLLSSVFGLINFSKRFL